LTSLEQVGDHVGQLGRFLLVEAALRDPRGPEADPGRLGSGSVAGDGVAVDDDARQVEDARRLVARERRAVV
jgi:hypothetical protein